MIIRERKIVENNIILPMRAFILWSYLIFVHVFVLSAQQTSQFGDLGNGMFRNPVIPSDYSDPDIIRVGEDYYGIASTFCFSPGMIVIHSKDLVHWEIINHVVDDISFLNPELDWTQMKGYYNGVWAGSLRYHDGMFYCHFATPRGGWFVATTSDIRGKWEVKAMRDCNGRELRGRGWDDLCPLWDGDGHAYIIASNFGKYCLLFNENDFVVRQTVCRVCYSIIGIILPVSLLNSLVDSVENIIILKLHNLAKFHEIQL